MNAFRSAQWQIPRCPPLAMKAAKPLGAGRFARRGLWPGLLLLLALLPLPARAYEPRFELPVLGAVAQPALFDSYPLPVAVWSPEGLAVQRFEGQVDRRAWRLDAAKASLLEVLAPLRDQLLAQGYEIVLDCDARACGGFDFRFNTEVMPEPGMHVDMNAFRFVAAQRGKEAVSLMVSRSAATVFVQVVTVGAKALPPVPATLGPIPRPQSSRPIASESAGANPEAAGQPDNLAGQAPPEAPPPASDPSPPPAQSVTPPPAAAQGVALLQVGLPMALDDLVFDSGSARLTPGNYPSLAELAAWMQADPGRRLILVGHTDLSGAMTANIPLSKRRAEAVREALIRDFNLAPARLQAEGAGPLSPRADNATPEGREKNRRVEAIPNPL